MRPRLSQTWLLCLVLSLVLATATTTFAADPQTSDVVGSELEARGQSVAFASQLAEYVSARPNGPATQLALLRLRDLLPQNAVCREAIAATLTATLPQIRDATNRALALEILAHAAAAAGDWSRATQLHRHLAPIRTWLISDLFGQSATADLHRRFAVEQQLASGPLRDGNWQHLELGGVEETIVPSDHTPEGYGLCYLRTQLHLDQRQTFELRIRTPASYALWWNGRLVVQVDRDHEEYAEDQRLVLTAAAGWHQLVIKLANPKASLQVWAPCASGYALPFSAQELPERATLAAVTLDSGQPGDLSPTNLGPIEAGLVALYARRPALTRHLLSAARVNHDASAHLHFYLALAYAQALDLSATARANRERQHHQRALAIDPQFVPAKYRLAQIRDEDGQVVEAFKDLVDLTHTAPTFEGSFAGALAIARREGWGPEAQALAKRWLKEHPSSAWAHAMAAGVYATLGNSARQQTLYEQALALDRAQSGLENTLCRLLVKRGKPALAVSRYRSLHQRYPNASRWTRRLASALIAAQRRVEAREILQALAARGLDKASLWRQVAATCVTATATDTLQDYAQRALAEHPQRLWWREELARLTTATASPTPDLDRLWISFDRAQQAAKKNLGTVTAHSVCVLDHMITRVYANQSRMNLVHQIFRILDGEGVERYHTMRVPGQLVTLRTVTPDGTSYEPVAAGGKGEYVMPNLEPGAWVEVAYRQFHSPPRHQLDTDAFFFRDPDMTEPFFISRWDVIVEPGHQLAVRTHNTKDIEIKFTEERLTGGLVHWRWETIKSPGIDREQMMPSKLDVLPWIRIVGERDWESVASELRAAVQGRTRLSPELIVAANRACDPASSPRTQLQELYRFVCSHIRNPGNNWFASDILASRRGARLILLKALCDARGLPASFAVATNAPGLGPAPQWLPPSTEPFSHWLLRVQPEGEPASWFSEGSRLLPFAALPSQLWGATALLLAAEDTELVQLPHGPLEHISRTSLIDMHVTGMEATLRWSSSNSELDAHQLKEQFSRANPTQIRTFLSGHLNARMPGATLLDYAFADLEQPAVPLSMTITARIRRYVRAQGDRYSLRLPIAPMNLAKALGGRLQRHFDVVQGQAQQTTDTVRIALPENCRVLHLPEALTIRTTTVYYKRSVRLEGHVVRIRRQLRLLPSTTPAERWPQLLAAAQRIDTAERQAIEIEFLDLPAGPPTPTEPGSKD